MNDHADYIDGVRNGIIIEQAEYNLFSLLKPRIFIDGNQWCVLHGENLQDGVAGFGTSPYLAVLDFSKAWNRELPASLGVSA